MELMPIDSIIVTNKYLRTDTNVDKLKKSIETVGLINPLVINQQNELIAGGRRYTALKELGRTEATVVRVDKNEKEQELISIDENLVRKDLNKMEFEKCLNRGREIYEELYPEAKKVEEEDLTTPEGQEIQVEEPNERRSFVDLTAEKTGLSKRVIKSAIDRDANSSKLVKELRAHGELSATQVNELIKLDKEDQDKVVELVADKPAKAIKSLVKIAQESNIDNAIEEVVYAPQLPSEYISVQMLTKKMNKMMGKILLEEISSDHQDMDKIIKDLTSLRNHIDNFLLMPAKTEEAYSEQDEDSVEVSVDDLVANSMTNSDEHSADY